MKMIIGFEQVFRMPIDFLPHYLKLAFRITYKKRQSIIHLSPLTMVLSRLPLWFLYLFHYTCLLGIYRLFVVLYPIFNLFKLHNENCNWIYSLQGINLINVLKHPWVPFWIWAGFWIKVSWILDWLPSQKTSLISWLHLWVPIIPAGDVGAFSACLHSTYL